ncbi:MAG: hypothetical protein OXU20_37335, partial [Myxococcales bacterium]|nr:hypothetical protein [Myxococcales bacterium]
MHSSPRQSTIGTPTTAERLPLATLSQRFVDVYVKFGGVALIGCVWTRWLARIIHDVGVGSRRDSASQGFRRPT